MKLLALLAVAPATTAVFGQELLSTVDTSCVLPNIKFEGFHIFKKQSTTAAHCRKACSDSGVCIAANWDGKICIGMKFFNGVTYSEGSVALPAECSHSCWTEGMDVASPKSNHIAWVTDPRTCHMSCTQDKEACHYWTFNRNTNECFHRSGLHDAKPKAGMVAGGSLPCKNDTYPGVYGCALLWQPGAFKRRRKTDYLGCKTICEKDSRCVGATFEIDQCYMKENLKYTRKSPYHFTPVSCNQNCLWVGKALVGDFLKTFSPPLSVGYCQSACVQDSECKFFSFNTRKPECKLYGNSAKQILNIDFVSGSRTVCMDRVDQNPSLKLINRITDDKCIAKGRKLVESKISNVYSLGSVKTPVDCSKLCKARENCRFWSMSQAGCKGSAGGMVGNNFAAKVAEDISSYYKNPICDL